MSRVAPLVPEESDLLCEGCGYTLNGLPLSGNCPECGKPIEQSIGRHRLPTTWENPPQRISSLLNTTRRVIFRPSEFFQTITTRQPGNADLYFAVVHWTLSAIMFSVAAVFHLQLVAGYMTTKAKMFVTILTIWTVLLLAGLTWIAARLSEWEAHYRGLRLPLSVVLRGMYYHAAHYLPVAIIGLTIVLTYRTLLLFRVATHLNDPIYLYVLCGAIVISAIYLFWTYWIAMRNMMYANR